MAMVKPDNIPEGDFANYFCTYGCVLQGLRETPRGSDGSLPSAQLPVSPEGDAGGPSAHAGVLRRGVQQQSLLRGQGAWLQRKAHALPPAPEA